MTPLRVALVGCGQRSRTVYAPLWSSLSARLEVVAVCDPVRQNAERLAGQLGVRAYTSIRDLLSDRPMEAAVVVTPAESHHSISCHLSENGVHHLVETPMASTLHQAREMVRVARQRRVVLRVGENFFRTPIDRIVQKIAASDLVGPIGRIFCYADHTGYHNNSRWIRLFGRALWVQSVTHSMPIRPFNSEPQRHHASEEWVSNHFGFAEGRFVADCMANVKGFLGRMARPGCTEWHGTRGTVVYRSVEPGWRLAHTRAEVRRCSDVALSDGHGFADEVFSIRHEFDSEGRWVRTWLDHPTAGIEHVNPYRPATLCDVGEGRGDYGSAVMDHLCEFASAVRSGVDGVAASEFDEADALSAAEMEAGARESALHAGRRLPLPLTGDLETDAEIRAGLRGRFGRDPYDVAAMLDLSFPKP